MLRQLGVNGNGLEWTVVPAAERLTPGHMVGPDDERCDEVLVSQEAYRAERHGNDRDDQATAKFIQMLAKAHGPPTEIRRIPPLASLSFSRFFWLRAGHCSNLGPAQKRTSHFCIPSSGHLRPLRGRPWSSTGASTELWLRLRLHSIVVPKSDPNLGAKPVNLLLREPLARNHIGQPLGSRKECLCKAQRAELSEDRLIAATFAGGLLSLRGFQL